MGIKAFRDFSLLLIVWQWRRPMREKWALWGTLVFAIAAASPHPAVADTWPEAELHIQRLSPSVVVEMPATIVQQLNARGCRIPQWSAKEPNNVIRGRFAAPRQVDWTVLCSRNHQSSIMVFWGGRAKCEPSAFGLAADKLFLTGNPRDDHDYQNIHYSRAISPANVDYILATFAAVSAPVPGLRARSTTKASKTRLWARPQESTIATTALGSFCPARTNRQMEGGQVATRKPNEERGLRTLQRSRFRKPARLTEGSGWSGRDARPP
jgi:hypothetical protein